MKLPRVTQLLFARAGRLKSAIRERGGHSAQQWSAGVPARAGLANARRSGDTVQESGWLSSITVVGGASGNPDAVHVRRVARIGGPVSGKNRACTSGHLASTTGTA